MENVDRFTRGYIDALRWVGVDVEGEEWPEYDTERELAPETLAEIKKECREFQEANESDLDEYEELRAVPPGATAMECAGHDFYLTRNGHGVGLWDRGLGELGEKLTEASEGFGEVHYYAEDDGLIHGYGG